MIGDEYGSAQEMLTVADAMVQNRRLRSALALYQRAAARWPRSAQVVYNLGAFHYCYLGDGVTARRYFLETLECSKSEGNLAIEAKVYARENLMLLPLSYDEYQSHAAELERLDPTNPILSDHRRRVNEAREGALPWSTVLGSMALLHHDPHRQSGGEQERLSECAATWHLLLSHRQELRLPRREWGNAVIGYGSALLGHSGRCGETMTKRSGRDDPQEVVFMLQPAVTVIQGFLADNPDHPGARQLVEVMEKALRMQPRRPKIEARGDSVDDRRITGKPGAALGCASILLGGVLGAVAGHLWIVKLSSPWNAAAGGAIGLYLAAVLVGKAMKRSTPGRSRFGP